MILFAGRTMRPGRKAVGRLKSVAVAAVCSVMLSGCITAALAGATLAGADISSNPLTKAGSRNALNKTSRLKNLSASAIGTTSDNISISDRDWQGMTLHWTATLRDGRRFRCEAQQAAICHAQ